MEIGCEMSRFKMSCLTEVILRLSKMQENSEISKCPKILNSLKSRNFKYIKFLYFENDKDFTNFRDFLNS